MHAEYIRSLAVEGITVGVEVRAGCQPTIVVENLQPSHVEKKVHGCANQDMTELGCLLLPW